MYSDSKAESNSQTIKETKDLLTQKEAAQFQFKRLGRNYPIFHMFSPNIHTSLRRSP